MENQRYYQSEEKDDKDDNNSTQRPAHIPLKNALFRNSEADTPLAAPRRAEHVPLEGIITLRERSDEEVRRKLELNEEGIEKKKDDSEKNDDKKEKKPKETHTQPVPPHHRPVAAGVFLGAEHAATKQNQHNSSNNTGTIAPEGAELYADAQVAAQDAEDAREVTFAPVGSPESEPLDPSPPNNPMVAYPEVQPTENAGYDARQSPADIWPQPMSTVPAGGPLPYARSEHNAPDAPIPRSGSMPTAHENQQPFDPWNPDAPQAYASPAFANAETQGSTTPAMPIEHPFAAPNHDPRLGPVASTLGLGLAAEHMGRKHADRALEERVNERTDARLSGQEQQMAAATMRLQEQQRQFALQQEQQYNFQPTPDAPQAPFAAPQAFGQHPESAAMPAATAYQQPTPEQRPQPNAFTPIQPPRPQFANEQIQQGPPMERSAAEQPQQNQAEHQQVPRQHVEHSSWHNIVVDEHGKEVTGAMHYGEGFQRERKQETNAGRPDTQVKSQQQQSVAPMSPAQFGVLPSGMTNPTLPQGQPSHVDPQHQLPAHQKQQVASNVTNPWFWIMLLLIIAAFFTAAFV